MKINAIAFYLPQYHPTPNNDIWWGKGFTEWTNVAKAKKLFPGHYQPHIPADLGFYDLRLPIVRQQQADLARKAGINGFCYYHYWFGDGVEELSLPFHEVVNSNEPNFPFCLCWANESWYKKLWNNDGSISEKKILAEQKYLGLEDDIKHFNSMLKAFQDKRYIKIDGRLLFVIYKPLDSPTIKKTLEVWQKLAVENGLKGFYFAGFSFLADIEGEKILDLGFDAVISCRHNRDKIHNISWAIRKAISVLFRIPRISIYNKLWPKLIGFNEKNNDRYIPVIIPNWDHTPRSGVKGDVIINSTPKEFKKHCLDVFTSIMKKNNKVVFIKSWNEWGEGNYMEPDLKYGHGYINAMKEAKDESETQHSI